ncbi:SSI family serine proteinase inhibitor [Spirillospora sp. CA-294931]|uniref:SSI family serine proteinase inhibitor n=1 Tax=Spirillospora sp. CA-294931 TaxID=3240042 RepID=UPI003D8A5AD6
MIQRRTIRRSSGRFIAAAVLGAAPLVAAAPASAGTGASSGAYVLVIAPEDTSRTAAIKDSSLRCGPAGGSHTNAPLACAQLQTARGRVGAIPEDPGPCTREYAPVRVSAHGTWNGSPRHYTKTFSNLCTAVRGTGGVIFAF